MTPDEQKELLLWSKVLTNLNLIGNNGFDVDVPVPEPKETYQENRFEIIKYFNSILEVILNAIGTVDNKEIS